MKTKILSISALVVVMGCISSCGELFEVNIHSKRTFVDTYDLGRTYTVVKVSVRDSNRYRYRPYYKVRTCDGRIVRPSVWTSSLRRQYQDARPCDSFGQPRFGDTYCHLAFETSCYQDLFWDEFDR